MRGRPINSSGTIVRLIDVALNILFGFIIITDIQPKSQIRLPAPEETPPPVIEQRYDYVIVKIDPLGHFRLEAEEQPLGEFQDLAALETFLRQRGTQSGRAGRQTIVVIDPEETSILQRTVDVFDLCERNGIAKSIHFKDVTL
ncbi:MAG: biopolymer transporter ExbD [candidate division KSB1 bacterium]|nr:biopolymer transporter ExbD [candidate division KSB1 bacterium]MDZ7366794.1 biopolymer transporter ExbD [candidate division KSB1 bacterium]